MMTDFSRRYDGLYVWGGRWNEEGTQEDFFIYPNADSPVPPYVSSLETYGGVYRQVSRIVGGAPRPRRTMSLYFGNIRPPIIPPSAGDVNTARTNLIEAGYKALVSLFAISRHNYQVVVPGSMLAHTRPGFRVNGQFRFPSITTEQPYETLRCLTMSVSWSGDGTATTLLDLSNGFESLSDYRVSDYGRDRYAVRNVVVPTFIAPSTVVPRVNYNTTAPVVYVFPAPYASPPLVTVWDAPDGEFPLILNVSSSQVTFVFNGYFPFPGATYVDLAITPL